MGNTNELDDVTEVWIGSYQTNDMKALKLYEDTKVLYVTKGTQWMICQVKDLYWL